MTTRQVGPAPRQSCSRRSAAPRARRKSRSARASPGIVEKQLYDEGTFVRAGAPLFQIDRAPFEIALAQAKAAADQAEARTNRRVAKRSVCGSARKFRCQQARRRGGGDRVSLCDCCNSRQREPRFVKLELNLSYTSVAAPIAGVTGRALHSEGSLVTANTDSSLLTTISQTHPVWVRFAFRKPSTQPAQAGDERRVGLILANGETYSAAAISISLARRSIRRSARCNCAPSFRIRNCRSCPVSLRRCVSTPARRSRRRAAVSRAAGKSGPLRVGRRCGRQSCATTGQVGEWVGQDWIIQGTERRRHGDRRQPDEAETGRRGRRKRKRNRRRRRRATAAR